MATRTLALALACIGAALPAAAVAAFPLPATESPRARAACPRAAVAPVIDGRLDDPAWSFDLSLDVDIQGAELPRPRFGTHVATAWDDSFLYIAAAWSSPTCGPPTTAATR